VFFNKSFSKTNTLKGTVALESFLTSGYHSETKIFFIQNAYEYTDKKENQIFLIYKEIQSGAVAKSYMRRGFLIYEEMRKY
jgi:hypothetical protein